jgi:hypothetical protein
MRITKVKVGNKTVLMHRNTNESNVVFENETNTAITEKLLPKEKRDSFLLSIKNQTVLKKEYVQIPLCEPCKKRKKGVSLCKKCKQKENYLLGFYDTKNRKYINGLLQYISFVIENTLHDKHKFVPLQNATEDDIRRCLNPRFQKEFKYGTGENTPFNLPKVIFEYQKTKDYSALAKYKNWAEWYIITKSEKLKQSVYKNIIPVSESQYTSTRKKALQKWKEEFLKNGTLDLECKHSKYQIDDLISDLQNEPVEYTDKGYVKNKNEYHRKLKRALQKHQSEKVFGKADSPNKENRGNAQLQTYHAEMVKYLEHYFPIKSSKRNNTEDGVKYYLDEKTIKSTIQKQLENTMRNFLLQEGKYNFHELTETTDSDTLSLIKQREAFVLNLISVCAFASNNIRNIVDTGQASDILVKKELRDSLEKNSIDTELFQFFFNYEEKFVPKETTKWKETMWALRGAVQEIRNNIIHYKKDALNTVFSVETFENEATDIKDYTQTLFKDYACKDIASLNESVAKQLTMNGVLEYYNIDVLSKILKNCEFSLIHTHIPFTPGFKKIYKQGCKYQEGDGKKNNLNLGYYIPRKNKYKDTEEAKQYEARYFMLKLIYNNMFLPYFTNKNKEEAFKTAVHFVLKTNKDNAENKHKYAFKDIQDIKNETIEDYLKQTQSNIIHEYNKKKERQQDKQAQEVRHNFEKFLIQVFIKGFDSFLHEKFPDKCINKTENQFEYGIAKEERKEEIEKRKNAIKDTCTIHTQYVDKKNASHIAFYVLCKLLDANYLSTLRNELIKFRQCTKNDGEFAYNHLLEIIEICLLQADVVQSKLIADTHKHNNDITAFIESSASLKDFGEVYVQTDEQSPVIHKSIALIKKYGTYELLKKLIQKNENFNIQKSEYEKWKELETNIKDKTDRRAKLHEDWVNIKDKNRKQENDKKHAYVNSHKKEYENLCNEINRYNWLDNKLHCEHLRKLHSLLIEVLGRMAGFVALRDRDFVLLIKSLHNNSIYNSQTDKNKYLREICNQSDSARDKRNFIAHYNYLTKTAEKSIIELIQELRALVSYDRKLKNAVTKSIIDIFDKHGMILKFKFNSNHTIEVQSIQPQKITHMKSNIKTDQVSTEYCNMCKELLQLKK